MHKNSQNISIGRGEREAFVLLRSQRLSAEEKGAMKKALQMSVNPARTGVSRPERQPIGFLSFFLGRSFAVSTLSLVLIVGSSLGVARAAERALPGETLYPVKIKVNEPFMASFKYSDTARREWEHERVERRMAEAEALAEEGRLGEDEKNEIEQQLSERRKTLEEIEGRDIDDDEFIPQQVGDKTKKTRVRFERQENEVRAHIEERESDGESDEDEEARSSSEKRTDGETVRKNGEGENKSSSKVATERQKTSDQKREGESDKKSSSPSQNSSSDDQESGKDNAEQDEGGNGSDVEENQ